MKRRLLTIVAGTTLAAAFAWTPVVADADSNGSNCVGWATSFVTPAPGEGGNSEAAKTEPGSIAAAVLLIRESGCP